MQTLFGFILAMSVTMVLIPVLMRWAPALGIVDMPEARKVHAVPVPRVGGIAMVAGLGLGLFFWDSQVGAMRALGACVATLLVFGVWDDCKSLAAGPKFAGQAVAAAIAVFFGGVSVGSLTVSERLLLPGYISVPLTFFFLLGGTNAFNLADGLDGLAGGMGVLCLCGIALLAYTVGNTAVAAAAVMMTGALIGFLRFNTHPARVFMGDGGSQVLGFCAAFLAVLLTQDTRTPLSTALPLLLLGVPMIDTMMVMIERLAAGVSPFRADRRHIHHRLLAVGFAHWEAVSILYFLQALLLVIAWLVRYDSDLFVALYFVAFAALIIVPLRIAGHRGWHLPVRRPKAAGNQSTPAADARAEKVDSVSTVIRDEREPDPVSVIGLQSIGGFVLAVALLAYATRALLLGTHPSHDVQILALCLAGLLTAGLVLRWRRTDAAWTDKVALYCCAALAIFLNKHGLPGALRTDSIYVAHPELFEYGLYGALALAMFACVRGSGERAFRLTPLDVLVLLVVVTVPNLPDSVGILRSLGLTIAELVLLFYSLEALSLVVGRRWRWLNGTAAVFLIGLALH
jgi:UDP-GlcNAc:undecaprenyl-phosphate GlcNAc-1-phosphate transferase